MSTTFRRIFIVTIAFRIIADASLLIPEARALAIDWGWPINDFWAYTIWPIVIVMGVITLRALFRNELDFSGWLVLSLIPFIWSIVLFSMSVHWTMTADGFSWIIVAICATLYKISEEKESQG